MQPGGKNLRQAVAARSSAPFTNKMAKTNETSTNPRKSLLNTDGQHLNKVWPCK
jgi:hypothetical protein